MNISNIKNIYINNKSSTAWLGDKPVIGDFVEIIIRHNGFGKVKYKHHVYGSKKEPQRDNYCTIIKVLRNKPCTLTLIPDSNKGCNYAEWQDNNGNQTSSNINMTFTPNGSRMLYAWFGLDEFTLLDDKNVGDEYYNTLPISLPVKRLIYNRSFTKNIYAVVSLPFEVNNILEKQFTAYKCKTVSNYVYGHNMEPTFDRVTILKPNLPYVIMPKDNITNLEFTVENFVRPKLNYIELPNSSSSDETVYFINTTKRISLNIESVPPTKYLYFTANNKYYYPNSTNQYMRAFRGFWFDKGHIDNIRNYLSQFDDFPDAPVQY